ncbi:MAG: GH25 family lysozyme [Anaerovoracaceae bacterium]|jgi:lysozyme
MKKRKRKIRIKTGRLAALAACAAAIILIIAAVVNIHAYFSIPVSDSGSYEIKGVDVSSYQGNIDWGTIEKQNIAFAYIKATEGSSHVDRKFAQNWENIDHTGIRKGAYHFMSLETSGKAQAENFISHVDKEHGMLPPVIDAELYGNFTAANVTADSVQAILEPLSDTLEKEYGRKPIIYTNRHFYNSYISGRYDNELWIADMSVRQPLDDGKKWTFCQYSISGQLKGYSGGVKSIDLDVFNGSRMAFFKYD